MPVVHFVLALAWNTVTDTGTKHYLMLSNQTFAKHVEFVLVAFDAIQQSAQTYKATISAKANEGTSLDVQEHELRELMKLKLRRSKGESVDMSSVSSSAKLLHYFGAASLSWHFQPGRMGKGRAIRHVYGCQIFCTFSPHHGRCRYPDARSGQLHQGRARCHHR